MKKKITSLLVVSVLALGVLMLAGCNWFEANSISFVNPPATTYVLGVPVAPEFTIEVNGTEYNYSDYTDRITVENFIIDKVGTRTAYVRFDNKFQLSFTYTVLDGKYSGGTGTQTDPYLVSTPEQFQNLLNEKKFNYYKLTRTIDFTGFELRMANKGRLNENEDTGEYNDDSWVGYIDGANYSLLNISTVKTPDGKDINKYNELFGVIGSATEDFVMKNITINFASTGSNATSGLSYTNAKNASIYFENVNITGYIDCSATSSASIGGYIGFVHRWPTKYGNMIAKQISFVNCKNSLKFLNAYGVHYLGGFISTNTGLNTVPTNPISFKNCEFDGLIEGSWAGTGVGSAALFAYDSGSGYTKNVYSFDNCTVGDNAKIVKTSTRNVGEVFSGEAYDIDNITGKADFVDDSFKRLNLTANGVALTASCAEAEVETYKVIISAGMQRWGASSAGSSFSFEEPVNLSNVSGNDVITLYKVTYKNDVEVPEIEENSGVVACGTDMLQLKNNVITYYCKAVCKAINVSKATVIVIGYDADGNAVAFGNVTGVNLAA